MPNRDIHVCKTERERNRDAKDLDIGVGDNMIPNSAKKQRLGFNTKGITEVKSTKKNDPFRRENW